MAEFEIKINAEAAKVDAIEIVDNYFLMRLANRVGKINVQLGLVNGIIPQRKVLEAQRERLNRAYTAIRKNSGLL